ncbi:TPA: hypothetical protein HA281_02225 [Candidatus Woesearchaeota archaeon]|nr:hypothetical protein [Candidatus Woesearchaeota archaeon]
MFGLAKPSRPWTTRGYIASMNRSVGMPRRNSLFLTKAANPLLPYASGTT